MMTAEKTDLAGISKLRIQGLGESSRTIAQDALPNKHRMAKGDIVTCGLREWQPDVVNERATIPTAKARTRMLRITELRNGGIINDWQWNCCIRFRKYWQESMGKGIAAMDYSRIKVDGEPFSFDRMVGCIQDFQKYSFLISRMRFRTSKMLHAVICWEMTIRKGVPGDNNAQPDIFRLAVDELDDLLTLMAKELGTAGRDVR